MTRNQLTRAIAAAVLSAACAAAQPAGSIEPRAGEWKTWLLSSGSELRLPPPPGRGETGAELAWLKGYMAQASPAALEQFQHWNAGAPPYRWIEVFSDRLRQGRLAVSVPSFRGYALLSVAMYDATVAAWDSKHAHNRPRPGELDASVKPLAASPRSPSYPSEHAVVAGAAATVLGYLFPAEAEHFERLAEEAARAQLTGGLHYPSDTSAGLELGKAVGRRAVAYARADGTDQPWTGSIPTGDGLWTGANPGFAAAPSWRPWFLARADEFRPPPPPAPQSTERAAEMAELKALVPRTFDQNAAAFYWQTVEGIHTCWFDLIHRGLYETGLDRNPPRAARAYALLAVAQFDSHIASNDGKFAYWAQRPSQRDSSLTTVFPNPNFPSYPSNHSTHSAARSEVIAYLFPHMGDHVRALGELAGLSRLWAGIHYRSDHVAGVALGRAVAAKLIERAQRDGSHGE